MRKLITYLQIPRHLGLAVAAASAVILSAAYISQYGFNFQPCALCIYQRVPYALNIVFGILAFLATFRYPRIAVLLLYFAIAAFFAGAAIAGFHVGVEQGWWKGTAACGGDILPGDLSIEQLRETLTTQPIVRCDVPAWTLFGISMAGYNFMLSLVLGLGVFYQLRKAKHAA